MRAALLAILVPLVVPAAAHAGANELAVVEDVRALRSSSADALTADSLTGGGLTYARAFDQLDAFTLWGEAGFEVGSANGTMFQTLTTDVGQTAFTLGARLSYALHRRVTASARLAIGTVRESLSLGNPSGSSLSDAAWGELARASIAAELRAIDKPRFGLSLRVELGYTKTSRVALSPHEAGPSDGTLTIPVMTTSFGHLDLSGPQLGFAVVSQF